MGHDITSLLPVMSTPFFFSRWKSLHLLDFQIYSENPASRHPQGFIHGWPWQKIWSNSLLLATAPGHGVVFFFFFYLNANLGVHRASHSCLRPGSLLVLPLGSSYTSGSELHLSLDSGRRRAKYQTKNLSKKD